MIVRFRLENITDTRVPSMENQITMFPQGGDVTD